jgi:hypothetical protein
MFHYMRNETQNGTLMRDAFAGLRRRLPPGWMAEQQRGPRGPILRLSGPDARSAELEVVVRSAVVPRDVYALLAVTSRPALIVAPYLGERARQLIGEGGASYADATGNLRVVSSEPAIFLEGVGAERDPDRSARPLHSLRGAAAGRVVRALAELGLPLGVRALSTASATPLGTVSRVVTLLEAEALLTRDAQRRILAVDQPALLHRWSRDYALTQSNELYTCLEPLGLPALWGKLTRLSRYAATGSTAGPGIAATRIAMLYVDDPEDAARTLGLVPAEAGANVWLLRPFDDVVYARTRQRTVGEPTAAVNVVTVSAAQAVVDLASAPGRGPQEAETMLAQMREANDAR